MADVYRGITVIASVNTHGTDVYDLASDAERAMLLLDFGRAQGYETDQLWPEPGRLEVYVTGPAYQLLDLLGPVIEHHAKAPYHGTVETLLQNPLFNDDAQIERFTDEIWQRYGNKVIDELEVE